MFVLLPTWTEVAKAHQYDFFKPGDAEFKNLAALIGEPDSIKAYFIDPSLEITDKRYRSQHLPNVLPISEPPRKLDSVEIQRLVNLAGKPGANSADGWFGLHAPIPSIIFEIHEAQRVRHLYVSFACDLWDLRERGQETRAFFNSERERFLKISRELFPDLQFAGEAQEERGCCCPGDFEGHYGSGALEQLFERTGRLREAERKMLGEQAIQDLEYVIAADTLERARGVHVRMVLANAYEYSLATESTDTLAASRATKRVVELYLEASDLEVDPMRRDEILCRLRLALMVLGKYREAATYAENCREAHVDRQVVDPDTRLFRDR